MAGLGGLNGVTQEARGIAAAVLDRLEQIIQEVKTEDLTIHYKYIRFVGQAAADGTIQFDVPLPPGVIWTVKRYAITGSTNGAWWVYLDEAQPQNLVEGEFQNSAAAADVTDIYVPQGGKIVMRFVSQTPGQTCTVNLRVTETVVDE